MNALTKKYIHFIFFLYLAVIFCPNVTKAADKFCFNLKEELCIKIDAAQNCSSDATDASDEADCDSMVNESKWCLDVDSEKLYTCTAKKKGSLCNTSNGQENYYISEAECKGDGDSLGFKPKPAAVPVNPSTPSSTSETGDTKTSGNKNKPIAVSLQNPLGEFPKGKIPVIVIMGRVTKAALGILGSIALLVFVYGGFMWLTSAGKSEQIKKGTDTMIWAVIGIFIIFSSYAILETITTGLGAKGSGVTTPGASQTGEDWCLDEKEKKCLQFTGVCKGKIVDSKAACEEMLKVSTTEVKKEEKK